MGVQSRLFGTDGIRGRANEEPLTPELAVAFGRAVAAKFGPAGGPVVIGRDTRISGPMLEQAVAAGISAMGVDVIAARALRRRFAYGCLDWSERRLHLGGALGAAFFNVARTRKWLRPNLDSRALSLTALGRREIQSRFGIAL